MFHSFVLAFCKLSKYRSPPYSDLRFLSVFSLIPPFITNLSLVVDNINRLTFLTLTLLKRYPRRQQFLWKGEREARDNSLLWTLNSWLNWLACFLATFPISRFTWHLITTEASFLLFILLFHMTSLCLFNPLKEWAGILPVKMNVLLPSSTLQLQIRVGTARFSREKKVKW